MRRSGVFFNGHEVQIPELRVLVTHPGQTPAQLAECFGYQLVPTEAWEQRHIRAAQQLVDGGADPNRIALFVVPPDKQVSIFERIEGKERSE